MPYYECPGCALTVHSTAAYSSASLCPNCSAVLTAEARRFTEPGARADVHRLLEPSPDAAATARRLIIGMPLDNDARERLELIVSELVTNALLHGGRSPHDPITLKITNHADRVRVAVHDRGEGFEPPLTHSDDPFHSGGRGCLIVEELSDAWGVERRADGCSVWSEILAA
jgi:anti-sigma regulatory factor (Ser/Thr protein kinase)